MLVGSKNPHHPTTLEQFGRSGNTLHEVETLHMQVVGFGGLSAVKLRSELQERPGGHTVKGAKPGSSPGTDCI